ncbi:MAG TPA: hypothetical protein VIF83_07995 [Gemmatimonadaceae bacterium]|jgi:hypothetical protein
MARQHAAVLGIFLMLAVIMTWPLSLHLTRAVAYPGDPYINSWVLDWDWHATFHRPLSLFDANIFYPARYSLAYSENLYGIAVLLFPLRAVGIAPITAHNAALLGGFALSGFAAYLLGRLITGSPLAGLASGIFYAFVPFRFTHVTHVQHVWGATLPLLLASLMWYAQKPTWRRAAVFAAAFLFNGLCNIHWLLFGSVAIAVTVAIIRPRILPLAACTAAAAVLLALFLQPYFSVARMYGMQRSWQETMSFSALPTDWLVSNAHNRLYASLRNPGLDAERWLFPGSLVLVLAVGALILSPDRKALRIPVVWILLGFFGSLGLHNILHRFLFTHVPGFRAIRVPARWAVIAYVGLAILVAIAAEIAGRLRAWAPVLLVIAFVGELWSAPVLWYMSTSSVPPVERWVAENKPRALIELPMAPDDEYHAMLRATVHHLPMVNGVSGFSPHEYNRVRALVEKASDALLPELTRLGITHVIVHADSLTPVGREWLARALTGNKLSFLRRFDSGVAGDWLFTIGGVPHPSLDLEAMLRGQPTRNEGTFGALLSPHEWETMTPKTVVTGIAFSSYGIREVNLLVNSGTIRLATELREEAALTRKFPWYPATVKPRVVARFPKRPAGVWQRTDMQTEIIDGRGDRILLEDRWILWP